MTAKRSHVSPILGATALVAASLWVVVVAPAGADVCVGPVAGTTTRASVSSAGALPDDSSQSPVISDDGRYVAFTSWASTLVAGDGNGTADVFVRDLVVGTTTRISVSSGGAEGNNTSAGPSMSGDGRYIAFTSYASNLVAGDANGTADVYVRDTLTGTTTRVSFTSTGGEPNSVSAQPSISDDGRYASFESWATNMVPGGDVNGMFPDIFVRDRVVGTTTRVSVSSAGVQGDRRSITSSISGDGGSVAFDSEATNLVAGDTNGLQDIFVRDLVAGTTTRVSVSSAGAQANGWSDDPVISDDGRYVAFASSGSTLVAGDANATRDVFVHDRQTATTSRVSVNDLGQEGNGWSDDAWMSPDGRYVAFDSSASNLTAGDANQAVDAFVHDRQTGRVRLVSLSEVGTQVLLSAAVDPAVSADGLTIAFSSLGSFALGDDDNNTDVYVRQVNDLGCLGV